jgi:tape measure domain-containing protein
MANERVDYTVNLRGEILGKLDQVINKMGETDRKAAEVESTFSKFGKGVAAYFAVDTVKSFATDIFEASIKVDVLNNRLKYSEGDSGAAGERFDYLASISNKLGLSLDSVAQGYTTIAAASKGTSIEGETTRQTFEGISAAAATLGLTGEQTEGALLAVSQMISKGKVQAEELRGQLGERLPGAFQLAAKAMGMTTAELDKFMADGKLMAEDFLPKFATELNNTFGGSAADNVNTVGGAAAIAKNEFFLMYKDMAEIGKPVFVAMAHAASDFAQGVREGVHWMQEHATEIKIVAGAVAGAVTWWSLYTLWVNRAAIATGISTAADYFKIAALYLMEGNFAALGVTATVAWGAVTLGASIVIGALITAWQTSEKFRASIYGIWESVKQVFTNIGNFFKEIFNPIFLAIDNLSKGNFKAAAINMTELLPHNVIMKAATYDWSKDVSKSYDKGYSGEISASKAKAGTDPSLAGGASKTVGSKINNAAMPIGTPTSKPTHGEVKQIKITIGSLVKDLTISVNETRQVVPKIKEEVQKALVALVNDINVIAQ